MITQSVNMRIDWINLLEFKSKPEKILFWKMIKIWNLADFYEIVYNLNRFSVRFNVPMVCGDDIFFSDFDK